jgi:hypothetical protein
VAGIAADRGGWSIGAKVFGYHVADTPDDEPATVAAADLHERTWDLASASGPRASVADVVERIA